MIVVFSFAEEKRKSIEKKEGDSSPSIDSEDNPEFEEHYE